MNESWIMLESMRVAFTVCIMLEFIDPNNNAFTHIF